jgi:hypothetical protein
MQMRFKPWVSRRDKAMNGRFARTIRKHYSSPGGEIMRRTGKVAMWLEAAAAPHSRDRSVRLRVHPLLPGADELPPQPRHKRCYAISVDGRWLYSNDGRLTVLKGMKAVDRFMRLINMSYYESGEPAQIDVNCGKTAHCMATGRNESLRGCA